MANESADQNLPTRAPTYSSAWVNEHTISIAGKAVEEKSNEITAIPDVLDSIDLTGAVVRSMPWGRKPILLREDCGIGGRLCLSSKKKSQTLI